MVEFIFAGKDAGYWVSIVVQCLRGLDCRLCAGMTTGRWRQLGEKRDQGYRKESTYKREGAPGMRWRVKRLAYSYWCGYDLASNRSEDEAAISRWLRIRAGWIVFQSGPVQ
jgi:hypothetical protein